MPRPVLVKLGGSLLTDKTTENTFRRNVARRLLAELAKANVPLVLMHGAGSFGHPQVARHRIGQVKAKPAGVSEVLAAVTALHGQIVDLAYTAGLQPMSFPLHVLARRDGDDLSDFPIAEITQALDEGYTPVLSGTLVRDVALGWRVVSADEIMAHLASELEPRLVVFATDVDGVYDADPKTTPNAYLRAKISVDDETAQMGRGVGADATGRMRGKVERALAVAHFAPTVILNGLVRNRLLDALKGKAVVGTRVER